jgi:hypothetical protein
VEQDAGKMVSRSKKNKADTTVQLSQRLYQINFLERKSKLSSAEVIKLDNLKHLKIPSIKFPLVRRSKVRRSKGQGGQESPSQEGKLSPPAWLLARLNHPQDCSLMMKKT